MNFFKEHKVLTILLLALSFYIYFNYSKTISGNILVDKKNKAYTNDLYMSDERIYNNYLDEKEQKMYDLYLDMLSSGTKKTIIDLADFRCDNYYEFRDLLYIASDAIKVDHPEVMNEGSWRATYENNAFTLKLEKAIPFKFMEELGERRIAVIIDNIKKETKDMSDKEKIKYVYNWIGNNANYDKMFTTSSKNQSIYSVFISKEAVCAGFAKASQVIFQNIGINSYTITGNTSGPHMWNIIEYEGKYYYFDSTVATSFKNTSNNYYDGLKQEKMNDYIMDHKEWYPEIEKTGIFS